MGGKPNSGIGKKDDYSDSNSSSSQDDVKINIGAKKKAAGNFGEGAFGAGSMPVQTQNMLAKPSGQPKSAYDDTIYSNKPLSGISNPSGNY
jgi:hypothetical protein